MVHILIPIPTTNAAIETGKTYTVLFPFKVDGFNLWYFVDYRN